MIHRISLYLAGQYPGHYRMPDRLATIFAVRRIDTSNFGDVIISQLQQSTDAQFFSSLLGNFQTIHGDETLDKLLDDLKIPIEVRKDPNEKKEERNTVKTNLHKLSKYLESVNETDFSRFVIMPILHVMGYENISYKGKVNETDFGLDFYPMSFVSPCGILHYAGIQTKATKMTSGDINSTGKTTNDLIEEIKTGFNQIHSTIDNQEGGIVEYLIFNSKTIAESTRKKIFGDQQLKDKKIKIYDLDGILSLIEELDILIEIPTS